MLKSFFLTLFTTLSLTAATFNVSTTPELRTALSAAATNGEDDTIILADGTYKTTDDGNATFIYFSNEANSLTLQGSSSDNVILSGDSQHQILNHQSTLNAPMTLEKLSFIDGNNTLGNGGAVYADYNIEVVDCNFSNNTASPGSGGGLHTDSNIIINNTYFYNNHGNHGGGFKSVSYADVDNSKFINNDGGFRGGGFKSHSYAKVKNSTFVNNDAGVLGAGFYTISYSEINNSQFIGNISGAAGAGFYSDSFTDVVNSDFISNNSGNSGAGFYASGKANILGSNFFDNNSSGNGAGFCALGISNIENCKFIKNNASNMGGAFYTGNLLIINSIISENTAVYGGGSFRAYNLTASNILISENNSALHIEDGEDNIVANSIFTENTDNIDGSSSAIVTLKNNYINLSKVASTYFNANNIFDGVTLGFVDEANGDYNLTVFSDLIDAGTTTITGLTLPATDLNGNSRLSGGNIDIGPYEFSTTRPTINFITYSGIAKEQSLLTFSVDYTLASGRAINTIEYDYANNGSWSTASTHTFSTVGAYTINVKITDSEGEFSTTSKVITIAALAFSDMTDEQKLVKAIDPAYYDEIVAIIDTKKNTANALGFESGKQYVLNNLPEYSLVSHSTSVITTSSLDALRDGWTLTSSAFDINDLSLFDNVAIIWIFNSSTQKWGAYSSNAEVMSSVEASNAIEIITSIPAGSGIWIKK